MPVFGLISMGSTLANDNRVAIITCPYNGYAEQLHKGRYTGEIEQPEADHANIPSYYVGFTFCGVDYNRD